MITCPSIHLAAEYPIRVACVAEDDRQKHCRADEEKLQALIRRGRVPQRDAWWNDVRIDADAEPNIAEDEQRKRQHEWLDLAAIMDGEQKARCCGQGQN